MVLQAAIKRGCKFALLDTLNFQAKPFYEKFGYKLQWAQENYPRRTQIFLLSLDYTSLPTINYRLVILKCLKRN